MVAERAGARALPPILSALPRPVLISVILRDPTLLSLPNRDRSRHGKRASVFPERESFANSRAHAMTRPISDAWFHGIKSATRDIVVRCGGVVRAGEIANVSKSEVSRWQSATDPDVITLPAVLALEADCGLPLITTVMAQMNGYRVEDGGSEQRRLACVIGQNAEVMRESAELFAGMATALSDGQITPTEAQTCDRLAGDLQSALSALREGFAAIKASGEAARVTPLRRGA